MAAIKLTDAQNEIVKLLVLPISQQYQTTEGFISKVWLEARDNTLRALETKGVAVLQYSEFLGQLTPIAAKLTDAGRAYAIERGWLAAPAKKNPLYITPDVKQTGSLHNVRVGDIVVWQNVYGVVDEIHHHAERETLWVIDENGDEHEWTDDDVEIFESRETHAARLDAMGVSRPSIVDTREPAPTATPTPAHEDAGQAAFKVGAVVTTYYSGDENAEGVISNIRTTAGLKTYDIHLKDYHLTVSRWENELTPAAPTQSESAAAAAGDAPYNGELRHMGDVQVFYHHMDKDAVFNSLVEYLHDWDFKAVIDEHLGNDPETRGAFAVFNMVIERAVEIRKQGDDTLQAESVTAGDAPRPIQALDTVLHVPSGKKGIVWDVTAESVFVSSHLRGEEWQIADVKFLRADNADDADDARPTWASVIVKRQNEENERLQAEIRALQSERDGLRAALEAKRTELDATLSELMPAIGTQDFGFNLRAEQWRNWIVHTLDAK